MYITKSTTNVGHILEENLIPANKKRIQQRIISAMLISPKSRLLKNKTNNEVKNFEQNIRIHLTKNDKRNEINKCPQIL